MHSPLTTPARLLAFLVWLAAAVLALAQPPDEKPPPGVPQLPKTGDEVQQLALIATPEAAATVNADSLAETTDLLLKLPHRLTGSPEGRAAGDIILKRLQAVGVPASQVLVQPFPVVALQLKDGDCYLEKNGQQVPLQPLRPNGLALSVTPPDGLRAPTVYLGDGDWSNYKGNTVSGRIAVLDYACGTRWRHALAQGATALLFITDDLHLTAAADPTPKWTAAHAAIPRFALTRAAAEGAGLLAATGPEIRLFSRQQLVPSQGRNIFVFIPGTPAEAATAAETLVLAAPLDTFGPLPFASRQAADTANLAALVELAGNLVRRPLPRSVLIAFFDANAQQQLGQYLFYWARERLSGDTPDTLARQLADRAAERQLLETRLRALEDRRAILTQQPPEPRTLDVARLLAAEAELIYNQRVASLSEARRDYALLVRRVEQAEQALRQFRREPHADTPETAAALAGLQAKLTRTTAERDRSADATKVRMDAASVEKDIVFALRKLLKSRQEPSPATPPEVSALLESILNGMRDRWGQRLTEIAAEENTLRACLGVGERLAGKRLVSMLFMRLPAAARAWSISGPAATQNAISNLQLERWLRESVRSAGAVAAATPDPKAPGTAPVTGVAPAFPLCAGFLPRAACAEASQVSGRATYVLELGCVGAAMTGPESALPDAAALAVRLAEVERFVRALALRPETGQVRLPPRLDTTTVFNVPRWTEAGRYDGCYVRRYDEKTKAGAPVPGAFVLLQNGRQTPNTPLADNWAGALTCTNWTGTFSLFMLKSRSVQLTATLYDAQGRISDISLHQPAGVKGEAGSWDLAAYFAPEANSQLVLFNVRQRLLFCGVRTPSAPAAETAVKLLHGHSDTPPKELNATLADELLAVYTGRLTRYKLLQGSQLLLNNSAAQAAGEGYDPEDTIVDSVVHGATDLWTLNETRLNNLRRHNIMENALERLHARAETLQQDAVGAAAAPGLGWARRLAAFAYSDRVYVPVRMVTNDLVRAVVILLLLAIPFAWAMERVIIGTPNVYRQILGFTVFFGAVFGLLYLVHPAFQFATFPLVVLLSFVIIIMSSMVIVIMWGKFEYEVRKLHGVAMASHQSTRTARGTLLAAVAQGIATMRRRPLRTTLTAITILLLTFTILFFGSFRSEDGVRQLFVGPASGPVQVEIGSPPGTPFDAGAVEMLRQLYAASSRSHVRAWDVASEIKVLAGRLPGDSVFDAGGYATMPPADLDLYPQLREALHGDVAGYVRDGGIFLPPALFGRIPGLRPEDAARPEAWPRFQGTAPTVDFGGRRYVLRGTFDPERLKAIRTLDGASFLPPDLDTVKRRLEAEFPRDQQAVDLKLKEMELEDFPPLNPDDVLLLWDPQRETANTPIHGVVFRPGTDALARQLAAESATLLNRRASLVAGGEHYRVLYASNLTMGGFAKVLVPLLLGGLIIFGTMLSSVSDRQKEIFTFSALGLGPKHVAALFFAEAAVYAVIGGMGGYLFAHAFAKVVELMARAGWVEAPAMNQSSMNAMFTILIVMATVLLSTIYPAFKASRAANPGVQRRWRMPEPDGDVYRIEFPFTVSAYDIVGLVSFLQEYLEAHRDRSVGQFAAGEVVVEHETGLFTLRAKVWLQPFDQGVSQTFILRTERSGIAGIDAVQVEMQRLSGNPAIWRRSARVFVSELRNQFVLWRTIPDDAAEHYHQLTSQHFNLTAAEAAGD